MKARLIYSKVGSVLIKPFENARFIRYHGIFTYIDIHLTRTLHRVVLCSQDYTELH